MANEADLQQQLQELQEALQQAQADNVDLQQQVDQQQQPPAPEEVPFALTPATAIDGLINCTTAAGAKVFRYATEGLDPLYDGSPKNSQFFLENVQDRASQYGWSQVLTVSNQATNPENRNLITEHRVLTMENVKAHALTYLAINGRDKQNSIQIYEFLSKSLTETMRKTMMAEKAKHELTVDGHTYKDGPCFLKALLSKIQVETHATNFHLRVSIQTLPKKIKELKDNIAEFNDYVTTQVADLKAGGETVSDLLVNVVLAYKEVEDVEFSAWIRQRKTDYDLGTVITIESLMDQALNLYNSRLQSAEWNAPSKEQETIIALQAQLDWEKKAVNELSRKIKAHKTQRETASDKEKPPKKPGRHAAWQCEKPRPGQTTRVVAGKTYKWCSYHEMWLDHDESECRAKKKAEAKRAAAATPGPSDGDEQSNLEITRAFLAMTEGDDEDSDDDEPLHA